MGARVQREDLRRYFNLSGIVVLYAGAHGPANGLDFVLDAALSLRERLPEVTFLLVGNGVDKPALVADAGRRQLRNVVFWDPIPKKNMPAVLGAADVGLHVLADVALFRYGVSPNKLYDYMAAGLPVVTNTGGEIAELVRGAEAGLAVEPTGIADGVRAMVQAGVLRRRQWGKAGRRYIEDCRSRTVLARQLEALLARVTSKAPMGHNPQ
jgi:glycosyltransferase involved in cell wall biosynthesis